MSDKAVVCQIEVYPHPNADKVQLGKCMGFQVVVGLEVKSGDTGVFFNEGLQLSSEFAEGNPHLMKYFPNNRRVRAQKFRGALSEGFWVPIEALEFANKNKAPIEETQFTSLNGVPICNKYINPRRTPTGYSKGSRRIRKGSYPTFQKHVDTDQLRLNWDKLPEGRTYVITYKLHGTSQRVGNCFVKEEVQYTTFWQKLWRALRNPFPKEIKPEYSFTGYKFLVGTRNVILQDSEGEGYHSHSFREKAASVFKDKLHKNEVVYYEVVGYEGYNQPIMGKVKIDKKDKDLRELYGDSVVYSYGCKNGQHDIYVYRIAHQDEDGTNVDYSWEQVKERCRELGVKHVPEFANYSPINNKIPANFFDMKKEIEFLVRDRPDPIDPTHPFEGIVLRVEGINPKFYKEKTFVFKYLEGIIKEREDYIDIEDVS